MLHRSTVSQPITFTLRGKAYSVAPGDEADIPAKFAYAVKAMGLPLEPVPGAPCDEPEVTETVDAASKRAAEWQARAERLQSEIDAARASESNALETLAQEREARDGFVTMLREQLGIKPSESIVAAIDALKRDVDAATAPPRLPAPAQGQQRRDR